MTKLNLPATLALGLLSSVTHAQEVVVTATRAEQSADQLGQSITVIDAAMLAQRQSPILADIIATTPGITMARTGGVGAATSLFIRGASSDHTLVVIDGVRVNDPSSPSGSFDFGNLLSGDVARVEILRGAESLSWGSAAIGGVVNVSTIAPTDHLTGTATAEGGSFSTSSLNAHLADTVGPLALSVGGGWYHTGGVSAFAKSEGGKEADGFDQHYANMRAILRLTDAVSLDMRGRYARSKGEIDGYATTYPYANTDSAEYSTTQELSGYAGIRADLLGGHWRNRLGLGATAIKRETFDAAQAPETRFEYGYKGRTQRIEYQGDARVMPAARLVFGAEHESSSFTTEADAFNPATTYRTHIYGFYGQAIVTPTTALTVNTGVRYDHHASAGDHVTFSANTAWRVMGSTILRASYAQGFKAPTLYQLNGDGGQYTSPNFGLRPETSTGYDFGLEQRARGGAITARASYFSRVSHDLIDYATSASGCAVAPFCGAYFNIGRARATGVETELILNPIKRLSLTANYAHMKSINADTLARLARRPDDMAALSVDWDAGALALGGTVQVVGHSFDDAANTARLAGYVLAGLRAAAPITKHIELYGRIDNLFDAQYQVVRHYGTLGRAGSIGVRVRM